jgi:hypothetical protein
MRTRGSPPVDLMRSPLLVVTSGAWMIIAACADGVGYSRLSSGSGSESAAGSGGSGSLPGEGGAPADVSTQPSAGTGAARGPGSGEIASGIATGGALGSSARDSGSVDAGVNGPEAGGAAVAQGGGGRAGGAMQSGPGGGPGVLAGGTGAAAPVSGTPRIISVDFVGTQRTPMAPTETAGFKPAANWNSAPGTAGTLARLVDQNGVVVDGAAITWSSSAENAVGFIDKPGDTRMMNGYLDPMNPAVPAQITVMGLPAQAAAAGFTVYVYAIGEITSALERRTYLYSIGSTQLSVEQNRPAPAQVPLFMKGTNGGMGNYVQFSDLSVNTFVLNATPGSGGHSRAPVNGIQIVLPGGI